MITANLKKFLLIITIATLVLTSSSQTLAAAPDGAGPWADSVLSSSQGLMKNGNPVPAIRSNPNSALGVAEDNTTDGNFYSLGFGGKISLGFDNGISSGVIIVEATNPGYPGEKANVEVSENGTTWVAAGQVTADGSVNKPQGVTCAKYVRLTDVSNPEDFTDETADGYDVDGVRASGEPCTPPTSGNGGGGCDVNVKQKNVTIIYNSVSSNANTGNNKAKNNTGGSTNVTTGNATSNVNITNTGGSNVANVGPCGGGNITAIISGNGAGSTNTININKNSKSKKK